MKQLATILLFIAAIPSVVSAQEAQPDTLDWHGYFPLEVGNRWQYHGIAFTSSIKTDAWYETWTVLADTTVESERYYLLEITCDSIFSSEFIGTAPCQGRGVERELIRYDEAANIVRYAPDDEPLNRFFFTYDFRLDGSFNAHGSGYIYEEWNSGIIDISGERINAPTKRVEIVGAIPIYLSFAPGIGYLGYDVSEAGSRGIYLAYARVGDQEYGEFVRLNAESPVHPVSANHLDVYPNPARQAFTVTYQLATPGPVTLQVFDLLGREVMRRPLGNRPPGEYAEAIDARRLSGGTYLVALRRQGHVVATQLLVVAR